LERKVRILTDWIIELFSPRDIAQTVDFGYPNGAIANSATVEDFISAPGAPRLARSRFAASYPADVKVAAVTQSNATGRASLQRQWGRWDKEKRHRRRTEDEQSYPWLIWQADPMAPH
jgi:hypothetical protein